MKTLILGGVRSGKSRLAEEMAITTNKPVIYIATAQARDNEMRERIDKHRKHRPKHWQVIEEPIQLAKFINQKSEKDNCVLVDCLTLWLTNLLMLEDKNRFENEIVALEKVVNEISTDLILVSNETNMGIIPMGDLSRVYCDSAGHLHQQLAKVCDRVILTIAGLPQHLKGGHL
jgi:adenosylcobinamide kinase/adenosylcobinamide-phosphate guanylyltransferase